MPGDKIFTVRLHMSMAGGAMLAAANLRALHSRYVYILGILSPRLRHIFLRTKVFKDPKSYIVPDWKMIIRQRIFDDETHQITQRFDYRNILRKEDLYKLHRKISTYKKKYDAIMISDYQKGTINRDVIEYAIRTECPVVFIDTKNPDLSVWSDLPNYYVKINATEYAKSYNANAVKHLIVTAGDDGAYLYHYGELVKHFPTWPKTEDEGPYNVIGAGDAFLACFTNAMLEHGDLHEAIRYANIGARASLRNGGQYMLTKAGVNREIEFVKTL